MKILLSFLVLCITIENSISQEKQLKIFSNLLYASESNTNVNSESSAKAFTFSPGLSLALMNPKGSFHEFGINNITYDQTEDKTTRAGAIINGAILKEFNIRLRYDYNLLLIGSTESKWKTYGGISISPYYRRISNNPFVSNSFSRIQRSFGTYFSLMLRETIYLSERILVDVSVPINVFNTEEKYQRIENPSIPIRQQVNRDDEVDTFPSFLELRVGVGVKI